MLLKIKDGQYRVANRNRPPFMVFTSAILGKGNRKSYHIHSVPRWDNDKDIIAIPVDRDNLVRTSRDTWHITTASTLKEAGLVAVNCQWSNLTQAELDANYAKTKVGLDD